MGDIIRDDDDIGAAPDLGASSASASASASGRGGGGLSSVGRSRDRSSGARSAEAAEDAARERNYLEDQAVERARSVENFQEIYDELQRKYLTREDASEFVPSMMRFLNIRVDEARVDRGDGSGCTDYSLSVDEVDARYGATTAFLDHFIVRAQEARFAMKDEGDDLARERFANLLICRETVEQAHKVLRAYVLLASRTALHDAARSKTSIAVNHTELTEDRERFIGDLMIRACRENLRRKGRTLFAEKRSAVSGPTRCFEPLCTTSEFVWRQVNPDRGLELFKLTLKDTALLRLGIERLENTASHMLPELTTERHALSFRNGILDVRRMCVYGFAESEEHIGMNSVRKHMNTALPEEMIDVHPMETSVREATQVIEKVFHTQGFLGSEPGEALQPWRELRDRLLAADEEERRAGCTPYPAHDQLLHTRCIDTIGTIPFFAPDAHVRAVDDGGGEICGARGREWRADHECGGERSFPRFLVDRFPFLMYAFGLARREAELAARSFSLGRLGEREATLRYHNCLDFARSASLEFRVRAAQVTAYFAGRPVPQMSVNAAGGGAWDESELFTLLESCGDDGYSDAGCGVEGGALHCAYCREAFSFREEGTGRVSPDLVAALLKDCPELLERTQLLKVLGDEGENFTVEVSEVRIRDEFGERSPLPDERIEDGTKVMVRDAKEAWVRGTVVSSTMQGMPRWRRGAQPWLNHNEAMCLEKTLKGRMCLAMLGRLNFKLKECDKMTVAALLLGKSGVGKSLLLDIVGTWFQKLQKGNLENKPHPLWWLTNIWDKLMVVCPEIRPDSTIQLTSVLKMIEAGDLTLQRRNMDEVDIEWTAPLAFAGNDLAIVDPKGALLRRLVCFMFDREPLVRDGSLETQLRKPEESTASLLRCLNEYHILAGSTRMAPRANVAGDLLEGPRAGERAGSTRTQGIERVRGIALRRDMCRLALSLDSFRAFLAGRGAALVFAPERFATLSEIQNEYARFCRTTGSRQTRTFLSNDDPAFRSSGLRVEKHRVRKRDAEGDAFEEMDVVLGCSIPGGSLYEME